MSAHDSLGTDDSRMVAMTGDESWETAARLRFPATLWLQSLGQNSLERKQIRGPDAGSQGGAVRGGRRLDWEGWAGSWLERICHCVSLGDWYFVPETRRPAAVFSQQCQMAALGWVSWAGQLSRKAHEEHVGWWPSRKKRMYLRWHHAHLICATQRQFTIPLSC